MSRLIQVCGDPTVDWFRIHNETIMVRGGVYYWQKQNEDLRVRLSSKPGGAALVTQLLREMVSAETATVEGITLDDELLNRPKDSSITTSWTVWKEFINPGCHQNSFRLSKWQEFEPGHWDYFSARLGGCPDLLVIQDSGLGFRESEDGWPEVLQLSGPSKHLGHIIYKLGQYNGGQANPVLDRIMDLKLADKTTIVTSLSDLRSCTVKIGVSLSWERMLEEVVRAVFSPNCPFVDSRGRIKYKQIIVPIGSSGAVIVNHHTHTLIFDRSGQEGDFAGGYPGQLIGDNTCVIASLATAWAENPETIDWAEATRIGTELVRLIQIKGYDVVEQNGYKHLQFPYQTISRAYHNLSNHQPALPYFPYNDKITDMGMFTDDTNLAIVNGGQWTILENTLLKNQHNEPDTPETQNIKMVNECARNIVIKGPQAALLDVPVETIGSWYSADRQEIEGVRSVNNAMRDYMQLKNPETPLCVAVFGPPGVGKSFVVKEIARGLGIGEDAQLTFNLSQFESSQELQIAFNQVRDLNLKGKTPLIFWDEFDTPYQGRPLGWLRYFLAPMQDGEFTDQGTTHPLGGGIYVFAGATRHSLDEFRSGNTPEDRAAKKPDFISRLRAYINIRGINGNPNTIEDRLYMIRRAFILRQYLELNAPQIKNNNEFQIEPGVLDAFLLVTKYIHGARSMENLLKMSNLADKKKYELSSLPPDHIIEMHVNSKEFNNLSCMGHPEMLRIGISGHINLNPEQIEKLESAVDVLIGFIERRFPRHYLTVFSPLAVGADRLVARGLLKNEASRLIAVLPFSQDEYINDFGSSNDNQTARRGAELRQEFKYWILRRAIEIIEMPSSPTRKASYIKAGYFIAEHSDIIIVVWDGQTEIKSSVTAQIVARADQLHKPICHIWAGNYKPDSAVTIPDEQHGRIRCKNFPGQAPGEWTNL